MALLLIGLVLVYSATFNETGSHWQKQLAYAIVGAMCLGGLQFVPSRFFYAMAYPFYALSLFPLLYIILFKRNSVERWISLPMGMHLQPSELAKFALLLAMARFLSIKPLSLQNPKGLIAPALLFFVPFVLVLNQPNLSTALSFVAMSLGMAYWAGLGVWEVILLISPVASVVLTFHQLAWTAMFLVLIGIMLKKRVSIQLFITILFLNISAGYGAIFIWNRLLYEHQRTRILTFVDPMRDPLGAGYQVLQSQVAIGSGRFLGKGLLQGTQTNLSFLPEEHTDFIFSVLGEQFGFAGCCLVLGLYFLLIFRIFRMNVDIKKRFVSLVAVGIAGIFSFHVIVNVAMTIGLMPVTGLPLPFLSYGGSFLITCLLLVGLLLNLRWSEHSI